MGAHSGQPIVDYSDGDFDSGQIGRVKGMIMKSARLASLVTVLPALLSADISAAPPSVKLALQMPVVSTAARQLEQIRSSTEPTTQLAWNNADYVDPGAATVIALIPGFFVHGLGHFYARDPVRGVILLGAQAGSVLWFFSETFVGMIEGDEEGSATGQIAAVSLYFGTWFYDFVHAGKAAENYNAKLHITLRQQHESTFLCATVSF